MKNERINLYDTVALMKNIKELRLVCGQVGTIIHLYSENEFEVEFSNTNGETIEILTLRSEDIMLLHYEAA